MTIRQSTSGAGRTVLPSRLGKAWVNSDGSLFLHSASDLHPGEQVRLTAVPQADSSYELVPYTFTLVSEGAPAATLTPTCAKRGGVYLDQEAQQTAIIFGADGKYVGTLRNGDKHLSNGAYTVVVVFNTVYNTSRWSSYFKYFSGTIENLSSFPGWLPQRAEHYGEYIGRHGDYCPRSGIFGNRRGRTGLAGCGSG